MFETVSMEMGSVGEDAWLATFTQGGMKEGF